MKRAIATARGEQGVVRGGPSRTISITMCDKDALEPMGRWWGLPVRPRGGKKMVCEDGPAFRIEASGFRAELIVNEMMKYGLSKAKIKQWRDAVRNCRNRKSSPRKHPTHRRITPLRQSLEGSTLARYSTGLFNGGGCSWCSKSGGRAYPRIVIAMCDRDALEPVGRWWGVRVSPRGEKAKVCAAGPAYQIQAQGFRARKFVGKMMKSGLSNRKVEQWRKVLSQCQSAADSVPR